MSSAELDETEDSGRDRAPRDSLSAGMQLGKYRLARMIGSGGMGLVWSAHDPDLERDVAIKVLRRADAGPELRARLLREARAMARLKHPNVLTVYEVGSEGDRDYIVMELVDGGSLDAWLAAEPPVEERWRAILAAGRGLAAAHAAGLVHRDFKPHNVLRGKDGRVLVTDFGLARGHGDELASAAAACPPDAALDVTITPPNAKDPVLSGTLTEPGSLLGTPAYMAPEQFGGAPSDPRTDQFAFCVTAWQALTGERPFGGNNVEELRRATLAGIANVPAKMPRRIRAVLARGLAVDPAARWPDLQSLLDALDRASAIPRRRMWIATAAIAVLAAGGIAAIALRGHPSHTQSSLACVPGDQAFGDVWVAARRDALVHRVPNHTTVTAIADQLDDIEHAWLARYYKACDAPASPAAYARLGCLLGERDELAAFTRFLDTLPASKFDSIDLWGVLPRVEACDGDSPVAPPLMPEDRKLRDRIVALRARLTLLRLGQPDEFDRHVAELVSMAREIGWQPIESEIDEAAGATQQLQGHYDTAYDLFQRAAQLAEQSHDAKNEATARISMLEVEADASRDPTEPGRAARLVGETRASVRRAGDDPVLQLSIDLIAAHIAAGTGDPDKAIVQLETARGKLLALRAFRQAGVAAADEARLLADHGDVATAWQRGVDTERAFAQAQRPTATGPLANVMLELAWRRADLDELHARADRMRKPFPAIDTVELTGKVVGPDGAPVTGARIVAWYGRLVGDAKRMYVRDDFVGEIATSDATGAFTIRAPRSGMIMAERDVLRSPPRAIPYPAAPSLTLTLAPTRTIRGHVQPPHARDVHARFDVTYKGLETDYNGAWSDAAPVASDGSFDLEGVPAGGIVYATDRRRIVYAPAGDDIAIAWPTGVTLDIVMKPMKPHLPKKLAEKTKGSDKESFHTYGDIAPEDVELWVVRGRHKLTTTDELVAQRGDIVRVRMELIGLASATLDGLPHYTRDSWHAVVSDVAPGEITVCTTNQGDAVCTPFTIKAQPGVQAIELP